MSVRYLLRKMPRLQIRLSTLLVMVLSAGALMGMNFRPFSFYYPRPEWVEELNQFVPRIDEKDPDQRWALGLYGWPVPAYPTWNWMGNGDIGTQFPSWKHYTSEAADLHVACTSSRWNYKALGINIVFCLGTVVFAGVGWQARERYLRKASPRINQSRFPPDKCSIARDKASRSFGSSSGCAGNACKSISSVTSSRPPRRLSKSIARIRTRAQ